MTMLHDEWLEGELSESTCRISDTLNLLLDEEEKRPGRALSPREEALAHRIAEHLQIAEQLIVLLREERVNAG